MTSVMDNAQGPVRPFDIYQRILRERLQFFLDTLHPLLRVDVIRALQENGKLFDLAQTDNDAPAPAGSWSLLPLLIALHIAPNMHPICASSVAVSTECFICALDLLDDVEDGDQTPIVKELGSARVLNVSTALLTLAQRIILSLSQHGFPAAYVLRLLDTMQDALLIATTGQQRDLLAEQRALQQVTTEECIEIAAQKAGSLMSLACRIGALSAEASDEVCEQFSRLGQLLGIAHQLDNDCHDLYYLLQDKFAAFSTDGDESFSRSVKTDLVRGKKTLPIVLAAQSIPDLYFIVFDEEKRTANQKLFQEGIMAAWGICLLYRERARSQFQKIEVQQPISHPLRLLLGFA